MSLLLDALQRASREKEKLAESKAAGNAPEAGPSIAPAARPNFPDLTLEHNAMASASPEPSEPASVPVSALSLELEAVEPTSEPVFAIDAPADLALNSSGLSLDLVEDMPATHVELPMTAQPELGTADLASAELPPPTVPFVLAADAAQQMPVGRPGAAAENTPQADPVGVSPRVSAAADTAPPIPPPLAAAPHEASPKIAREILAAKAKPQRKFSPRLIGLAVVVLVIAAINAAFFLGYFDRWLGMQDSMLGPGVAVAPPPPASPAPTATEAPTAAPIPAGEGSAKLAAPAAEASPVQAKAESRTEKQAAARLPEPASAKPARSEGADTAKAAPRPARSAKPVVLARKAEVSPLDTAYAALTEGRFDAAAAAYRLALEKNTSERDALLGLAYIAHRQGNFDEAKARYQQVLRQDPAQADALAGLLSLAADGDLAGAASRARDMAERSPESAAALSSLGGILVREGRIAEAQQAFFRAFALEPESALHAYNLAVALDRLHKYAQAQSYYQRAIALAEKSSAAESSGIPRQQARQRLEQLRAAGNPADSQSAPDARRN